MAGESPSKASCDQQRIWSHFQNAEPEVFEAARPRLNFLIRQLQKHCRIPQPVILNIGVGDGYFEQQALARHWNVHSLDPDEKSLTPVKKLHGKIHVGRAESIPLDAGSCDGVVASEVLEHLAESEGQRALAEIARVLKPGGIFVGTVPYRENLRDNRAVCPSCGTVFHRWGHKRSFTVESLRSELAGHFSVKTLRRTAFVSYRRSGPLGAIKSLARLILAKSGQAIAVPSLYWFVVK
jgi:SAM-dependent methyltransferase